MGEQVEGNRLGKVEGQVRNWYILTKQRVIILWSPQFGCCMQQIKIEIKEGGCVG